MAPRKDDPENTSPGRPSAFFSSVAAGRGNFGQRIRALEDRLDRYVHWATTITIVIMGLVAAVAVLWSLIP